MKLILSHLSIRCYSNVILTGLFLILLQSIYAQNRVICQNQQTKKYGLCHFDTVSVAQTYDFALIITGKEFIVMKEGKWGTISQYGDVMIPLMYDQIWQFADEQHNLLVKKDNKYGIIDLHGKEIVPLYSLQEEEINTFQIDAHLAFLKKGATYQAINNGKMAIFNIEGKMIFDFLYPFVQDIMVHPSDSTKPAYPIFLIGEKGKYSFVDKKNKPLFKELVIEDMFYLHHEWGLRTAAIEVNQKIVFLNLENGKIIQPEDVNDRLDEFNLVQNLDDKMGVINDHGIILTPCIYHNITPISETKFATVEIHNKQGIIDYYGNVYLEPLYDNVAEVCFDAIEPDLYPYAVFNGSWLAVFKFDKNLNKLVPTTPFIYDDISCHEVTETGLVANLTDSLGRKGSMGADGKVMMEK